MSDKLTFTYFKTGVIIPTLGKATTFYNRWHHFTS